MSIGEIDGVVRRQVGNQTYFFGTVESDKIKGITYVPVIESSRKTYLQERPEDGYQRPGSAYRMRSFMRYLMEHPEAVVPPVLISAPDWTYQESSYDSSFGKLSIESSAAIIDGQHRVGGYIALFEEKEQVRPIDFIALEGLDREAESEAFVTVNNTQKGVPRALTAFLSDEDEPRIGWALNEEEDSPFKGRITRTSLTKDKLFALHSVAKNIKRTFDHGKLSGLDEDSKYDYLVQYWTIIADELDDPWADIENLDDPTSRGRGSFEYKLLELTGFSAWSLIGPEILARSYAEGVGVNWDHVRSLVKECGQLDWRKDGNYQGMTGEYGAAIIKKDMERKLPPDTGAMLDETEETSE